MQSCMDITRATLCQTVSDICFHQENWFCEVLLRFGSAATQVGVCPRDCCDSDMTCLACCPLVQGRISAYSDTSCHACSSLEAVKEGKWSEKWERNTWKNLIWRAVGDTKHEHGEMIKAPTRINWFVISSRQISKPQGKNALAIRPVDSGRKDRSKVALSGQKLS